MSPKQPDIILSIVDDHPVVVEGLKTLLKNEPGIAITESFSTGAAFMAFLRHNTVHVVLLDIMLPDVNGIDLCKDIKSASPDTMVLALSNQAERSMILQILQHGASGYLLKNASAEELRRSIAAAMHGDIAFSREVKEIISRPSPAELKSTAVLTKREKQILQLIAAGKSTPVMAKELNLSPLTIETHRRNLLQKFGVKNVAELIMAAVQQRVL